MAGRIDVARHTPAGIAVRVTLIVMLVGSAGGAVAGREAPQTPQQPSHDGQPLSYWIEGLDHANMPSRAAILAIGEQAFPALTEAAVTHPRASVRRQATELLPELGGQRAIATLARLLHGQDLQVRVAAVQALGSWRLGGLSDEVVAALIEALRDPSHEVRYAALEELDGMDPPAVKASARVRELLRNDADRVKAALTVAQIEPEVSAKGEVLDILLRALADPAEPYRIEVPDALRVLRTAKDKILPALARALQDESQVLREVVADALFLMAITSDNDGPLAAITLPALMASLKGAEGAARRSIVEAIGALGPRAAGALPSLRAIADSPDDRARDAAAEAIRDIARDLDQSEPGKSVLLARPARGFQMIVPAGWKAAPDDGDDTAALIQRESRGDVMVAVVIQDEGAPASVADVLEQVRQRGTAARTVRSSRIGTVGGRRALMAEWDDQGSRYKLTLIARETGEKSQLYYGIFASAPIDIFAETEPVFDRIVDGFEIVPISPAAPVSRPR